MQSQWRRLGCFPPVWVWSKYALSHAQYDKGRGTCSLSYASPTYAPIKENRNTLK